MLLEAGVREVDGAAGQRKAIAGNLAFPFSPSDLKAGDAYEFNVHHLVTVDDPLELFPIEMVEA